MKELLKTISNTEQLLSPELEKFWQLISIEPVKWMENEHGNENGGFWVVAIYGKKAVWYNDIEEGFNVSTYKTFGEIAEYGCEQYELNQIISQLYNNY
ncbi:hypothetical protein [Mucilaginibacter boryungensis]